MKIDKLILTTALGLALLASYGCGFLVGAAAGGTGGYILRDQGYKVHSPVEDVDVQPPIQKE